MYITLQQNKQGFSNIQYGLSSESSGTITNK